MKILKVSLDEGVQVSKVIELDKALKDKFSTSFPETRVYCSIGQKPSNHMKWVINEFDICCDRDSFRELPLLAKGFILGYTKMTWEKSIYFEEIRVI